MFYQRTMTPFPLHSRSTWLDEEKCQHSVIHKPHKSIPIYDEAIHDVYKPSKQTFPLLDLPSELLTQILIKLHPNKVKSLTRLSRAAHRRCRFTGFGAIWQHLYHYISAESSSLLPSSPSSPLSFLDSPFDLSEFQLLQSISWFHVNSNYMVALMMMKGGITPYTLSILIPEFESLNVLPPQPSRNLQPILRAFSEALERGLYLAVPECVPPVSIENATDSVPDKEEFREPGFPSAFVLFWLTTVDAIDVFADLVPSLGWRSVLLCHNRSRPLWCT
ncbi:hypothetical protein BC829DRAFT_28582 [Chytridium lagenaria]|nr:hypothetical protein BC829DRAFT_28582 [Chytridium lagenaria]